MSSLVRRAWCILFALLLLFPAAASAQDEAAEYHPGRVLVKFKHMPAAQELQQFAMSHQLRLEKVLSRVEAYRFAILQNQKVMQVVDRLNALEMVDYAEPDYARHAFFTPTDPMFSQQWDMTMIKLTTWWDFDKGSVNVVVAVIDTGVDLDHPDLVSQLWRNLDELPNNGIDDDHNGYKDDYNGFDFAGDGIFPLVGAQDPIPEDAYVGHGTHVSGTIAATQNNGVGISGEAPLVKIMAVRVLGGMMGSGYASDIANGVIYAAENGAHVINMSLGGTGKSTTEYNALKFAWDHNVFIAAAAGNDGDTGNPVNYPAAYVFAMSVGATDSLDNIASFSTHNEFVEISAPGVNILSTIPGGVYEGGWSGTSMATPHVAGLAALLYSMYTTIDNWEVRSMLQKGVIDRGTAGWDQYYGYGRADCVRLLATPTPSPSVLKILAPAKGIKFTSGAAVGLLWNPVLGASSYRMTVTLPNKTTKIITTKAPYYTVSSSQTMPLGSYTVKVDALTSNGMILSYDTISFSK
jgi:thermitase